MALSRLSPVYPTRNNKQTEDPEVTLRNYIQKFQELEKKFAELCAQRKKSSALQTQLRLWRKNQVATSDSEFRPQDPQNAVAMASIELLKWLNHYQKYLNEYEELINEIDPFIEKFKPTCNITMPSTASDIHQVISTESKSALLTQVFFPASENHYRARLGEKPELIRQIDPRLKKHQEALKQITENYEARKQEYILLYKVCAVTCSLVFPIPLSLVVATVACVVHGMDTIVTSIRQSLYEKHITKEKENILNKIQENNSKHGPSLLAQSIFNVGRNKALCGIKQEEARLKNTELFTTRRI